ncbi:MAG: hypothetical protein QXU48_00545 [Thermoplasmata archaeon]
MVEKSLQNLHALILTKKGVNEVKCAGDATGYALTVVKHYRSIAAKRKKESKKQPKSDQKKHIFTYWFAVIDIDTKLYIAFGNS